MGVLLSMCQGNERPTKEELENKIQILLEETKKLKAENDLIRKENEKTNEDLTVAYLDLDRYKRKVQKYVKALTAECGKTADIIMQSTLHLDYLDDTTEKKHIQDVLNAVNKLVTKYN